MAAARSQLLRQYVGLSGSVISSRSIWPGTTPLAALVRIARRDVDAACAIEGRLGLCGQREDIPAAVDPGEAVRSLLAARARLLSAAAREHTSAPAPRPWVSDATPRLLRDCRDRDLRWARRFEWWNEEQHLAFEIGPLPILVAAARAARKELLTSLAILSAEDRTAWRSELINRSNGEREAARSIGLDAGLAIPGEAPWDVAWRSFHDTHHALVSHIERGGSGAEADMRFYRPVVHSLDDDRTLAFAIRRALTAPPRESAPPPSAPERHTPQSAPRTPPSPAG